MQKLSDLQNVILYIEQHLTEELNPEAIAGRHFISRSQLYRDFYACTGHSVKEYIRKRRISNACEKIKCSDIPFSIIADESGCQTQQAFNKLFKSIVGKSPLEYRQGDSYFYFYPFTINEAGIAVKVGTETIPKCTTTQFYDTCLIGIEDKAIASLGKIKGRVFGRNGKQIGSRLCYEILTEQKGAGKADFYATCVVNYNEPVINNGWNYLYNIWLSASMFEESGDGYFEEYIFSNGKPRKLKLYLPVKKRKIEQQIVIAFLPETTFIIARESGYKAERKASERVITYLQNTYPIMIRNTRRFFLSQQNDDYICGVECSKTFRGQSLDSGLEVLSMAAGYYAVLPYNCLGDISVGRAKIEAWCVNNAIPHVDESAFAVYETKYSEFDNKNIHMNIYKRLKIDTNG